MSRFNERTDEPSLKVVKKGFQLGWRTFFTILAALYMLYCVIYVLDILPMVFGKSIQQSINLGVFLGIILFLAFLYYPFKGESRKGKPAWYDIIPAILSLVPTLYYSLFFESTLFALEYSTPINSIMGGLLVILVWEAARRTTGWPFALIIGLAMAYILFGSILPGVFKTSSFSLQKVLGFMYVSRDGIIGIPTTIASKTILTFLLFAQILFVSGAGDWFVNVANSIVGHVRGGPAKAAVVGSGLLGMITASPPANVASVGTVTIPLMKKLGFKSHFAAGVEAVASTGGQLMPPIMGSVVFVLCEYIGMPYGQLIIYAFIPAILYYLALFIQVDLYAAKTGIRGLPKADLPPFLKTVKQGYWYVIPIAVLLICMIVLDLSAEKSAIYALFTVIIISMFRRNERMGIKKLAGGAEGAMRSLVPVAVACAGCGIITGSLTLSLVSYKLAFSLTEAIGQNLILVLLLEAVISLILGMGVGPLVSYLTLAMMAAPVVVQMGVPVLAAHLFLFYWAVTCFITPPYAIASFVAAAIAKTSLWKTGLQAMRLGVGIYIVPLFFVYNPAILLIGSPASIVMAIVTAIVGIAALAAGLEGYLLKDLNWPQRILLMGGGFYLAISSSFDQLYAVAAIAAAVAWHVLSIRLKRPVPA